MGVYYIYLRKSRADSEHETVEEVLKRHEHILQEYALKELGSQIPENCIYREIVSGESIQNRPMMSQLLENIQKEDCTAVLVVDPQRLSRGDLQDCGTIIRAFQYTDTLIMTPSKTYHLAEKLDRKYLEMELMRGNDYLEYVKEIMLRGRLASVSEGNFIGSVSPYGYDKVKIDKSYTLAENQESDVVRLIFDLYVNQHLGVIRICQKLDEMGIKPRKKDFWTQATIQGILHNPVYIGKIRWNWRKTVKKYESGEIRQSRPKSKEDSWILVDGKHPALISDELFQAAQEKDGTFPKNKKKTELINPFAGICRCECGTAMVSRPSPKAQLRLMCQHQTHCHNKSVIYAEFEQEVVRQLQNQIDELNFERNQQQKVQTQNIQADIISGLQKDLLELEVQQDKLYDLLERGIYTESVFVRRNAVLAERRKALKQAIASAPAKQPEPIDYQGKILKLSETIFCIQNQTITPKEKNDFLKTVINVITYSRKMDRYDKSPFTLEISLKI